MKLLAISALVTLATATLAKIQVTNIYADTNWAPGQPATLTWNDSDGQKLAGSVNVELMSGDADNLQPVTVLVNGADASSGSATFALPDNLPSGANYAIRLTTQDGQANYSHFFSISGGNGEPASSKSDTASISNTTSAPPSSSSSSSPSSSAEGSVKINGSGESSAEHSSGSSTSPNGSSSHSHSASASNESSSKSKESASGDISDFSDDSSELSFADSLSLESESDHHSSSHRHLFSSSDDEEDSESGAVGLSGFSLVNVGVLAATMYTVVTSRLF
ncbi:hypothetical protein EV182_000925 [Spiromyces aspiralis]|uniref:Uncharacterized protein n=1 Tax=Spiromyces aspiralis TaxID=68401 RepID=A0ACC1HGD6_9FUNG|nr:hypothetical protein EV182_000925 [Spiromyces aspiralis]